MKVETERVLRSMQPLPGRAAPGWRVALPVLGLALLCIIALYWSTATSMAAIWGGSETFAHGYLIVPISLVLIWLKRRELAALAPRWDYLGLVLIAGAGLTWLVATAGHVQVIQQYAMTAMLPAAVVAVTGRRIAAMLAFPLAFLLFAVPSGDDLLPRLMDFTANFTVGALRVSGIPVYREGNFFAIPSGRWSVVEACSGLRYLIASLTVGALFAYLNFRRWWKRIAFVSLSIIVPILANGIRAYMIVMIGHLSDMKLAVGVDHFIYGWVFFGAVILLLFWLGSFFRDAPAPSRALAQTQLPVRAPLAARFVATALGVLALAAVWPLYAAYLDSAARSAASSLEAPKPHARWVFEETASNDWRPRFAGAAAGVSQVYRAQGHTVALHIAHYQGQRQGAELIGSANSIAGAGSWASVAEASREEGRLTLRETRLRSSEKRMLAWDWYRVSGRELSNPYLAKALLARDKLLGRGDDGMAIVLAAPYAERPEEARAALRQFMRDMQPSIEAALDAAGGGAL